MSGTGKARQALDAALGRSCTAQVRYWAKALLLIDPRWCGATGTGGYIARASAEANEAARAELKRRGDAERAAGLGPFSTVEAVKSPPPQRGG